MRMFSEGSQTQKDTYILIPFKAQKQLKSNAIDWDGYNSTKKSKSMIITKSKRRLPIG